MGLRICWQNDLAWSWKQFPPYTSWSWTWRGRRIAPPTLAISGKLFSSIGPGTIILPGFGHSASLLPFSPGIAESGEQLWLLFQLFVGFFWSRESSLGAGRRSPSLIIYPGANNNAAQCSCTSYSWIGRGVEVTGRIVTGRYVTGRFVGVPE